jgi:uncharacterized RDD family membrane protein YckC
MQCAVCSEEYADHLDECPQCPTAEPAPRDTPLEAVDLDLQEPDAPRPAPQAHVPFMTDNSNVTARGAQAPNSSTLIEFPGVNRPAWRRELSERFREIQQKRARDADSETKSAPPAAIAEHSHPTLDDARASAKVRAAESASKQLGLVPTPDEPELNPLVAAALRRIERARAGESVSRQGSVRGQAATAAARVVEEQPVEAPEPVAPPPPPLVVVQTKPTPRLEQQPAVRAERAEPATARAFVEETAAHAATAQAPATQTSVTREVEAVAEPSRKSEVAQAAAQTHVSAEAAQSSSSRQPRHISGVLDEFWLERQGIELLPKVEEKALTYDDRASRVKRMSAAVVDLLVVALLCAPFAAAIELSIGNWRDPRVSGSMALIAALVMFLYHTCSVALAGRTLGMHLCALHIVDARKACVPTTGQCARRAVVYMLSLATGGLGLLYSLFDAEGRTAHDILSSTVVVRD